MNKLLGAALACVVSALPGCGGGGDPPAPEADAQAALDPGTGEADMSPTLTGSGDMSSTAGAGAATAAMDGGEAGDDGAPPVEQGEGGPADVLDDSQATGR